MEVPLESDRHFKIAVLGTASIPKESIQGLRASEIGRAVASRGGTLLTGGCPGLPHAAVIGALGSGGLTVGISPARSREEHVSVYSYPLDCRIILYTGMGTKGRNVILVRSSDACIFIGGGMGTLNEFTIAFDELGPACAIGILSDSGGFSREFSRLITLSDKRPAALLVSESEPERLVETVFNHICKENH